MNLYLITRSTTAETLLRDLPLDDSVLATSSWHVEQVLTRAGHKVVQLEDLLSPELVVEIDRFIFQIVRGWYRFQERDFTLADGLSLGRVHEYELIHCQTYPTEAFVATAGVAPFVRAFAQYKLLLGSTPARTIYHDIREPAPLGALQLAASQFKASLHFLEDANEVPAITPAKPVQGPSLAWRIRNAVRWRARRLAERLRERMQPPRNHGPGILAVDYPCLRDAIRLLEEKGYTIHTPEACFRPDAASKDDPQAVTAAHHELKRRWEQVRAAEDYRARFEFLGVSCWPFFDRFLSQVVTEQFPATLRKARLLRAAYVARNIKAVLVPFDEPNLARLCVLIAQELKIPEIVCLHGLTAHGGNDTELMTASHVLVISEHDRQAVLRKRPDADVQVVGCLQTDQYLSSAPPKAAMEAKPLRILVLTYGPCTFSAAASANSSELYLTHITNALNAVAAPIQVTFKLHPSEKRMRYEKALGILAPAFSFSIVDGWKLPELLPHTDLLVGPCSTSFAEALTLRKPAVFVNTFRGPVPAAFTQEAGLRNATSKEELAAAVREAASNYQSFLRNYDFETPLQYLGPKEGKAAERVASIVKLLALA